MRTSFREQLLVGLRPRGLERYGALLPGRAEGASGGAGAPLRPGGTVTPGHGLHPPETACDRGAGALAPRVHQAPLGPRVLGGLCTRSPSPRPRGRHRGLVSILHHFVARLGVRHAAEVTPPRSACGPALPCSPSSPGRRHSRGPAGTVALMNPAQVSGGSPRATPAWPPRLPSKQLRVCWDSPPPFLGSGSRGPRRESLLAQGPGPRSGIMWLCSRYKGVPVTGTGMYRYWEVRPSWE